MPLPTRDLYERLQEIHAEMDHHESDLYVKATLEVEHLIQSEYPLVPHSLFRDETDGSWWYDFPFAYTPFWADK